ncbi:hypothetical protein [Corynebacterium casei]|uniref:hypothetical protein n=1 Tax=Corynebacterium casei TaxID=160386 RepID=UPI003BB6F081
MARRSRLKSPLSLLCLSPELEEFIEEIEQLALVTQEARRYFGNDSLVFFCAWYFIQGETYSYIPFHKKADLIDVVMKFDNQVPRIWSDQDSNAPEVVLSEDARDSLKRVIRQEFENESEDE